MNFLKRLEIQGFKSFAAKTVLEFPARIVAVVGPNGSGKSNIIDAMRWALGEREAKQLRGETIENLIFAGTAKKPAAGFARVALYFDNKEKNLPVDFEEMVVERKVDRSAVSQFFCNDSEIRLRDLVPLLARARLSSRGLNMIGQGDSDVFVRSNPEERRLMIEEILGLREFRFKKNQAERRLDTSRINMDKVEAMLEELTPHLRILRRQKNRFEKRNEIETILKELENKYFAFRYHQIDSGLKDLAKPVIELEHLRREKQEEIAILEANLREIDKKSDGFDEDALLKEKLNHLINDRLTLEKALTRLEVRKEFQVVNEKNDHSLVEFSQFIKSLRIELEKIINWNDLEKIKQEINSHIKKIDSFIKNEGVGDDQGLLVEEQKIKNTLEELDKEIDVLRAEEQKQSSLQKTLNQEFRRQIETLEIKKNESHDIDRMLQSKIFEKEKLHLQCGELEREWQSFGRFLSELKSLIWDSEPFEINEAERKMMRLRAELAAIGEIDPSLVKEADESEKRHEFLSHELADLEKAMSDLKTLIKELEIKINNDFKNAFHEINEEFNKYFRLMFDGGRARMKIIHPKPKIIESDTEGAPVEEKEETKPEVQQESEEHKELSAGVEIDLNLPKKRITNLEMLSGGEKSLVSLAALFALISVSPPPFLVLDEIDAALDETNASRFAELIKEFAKKTQFLIVTHNRATMEAAEALYGITMGEDGVSTVLSLKLEAKS